MARPCRILFMLMAGVFALTALAACDVPDENDIPPDETPPVAPPDDPTPPDPDATPPPDVADPTPAEPAADLPAPQAPPGSLRLAVIQVDPGVGLNRGQAPITLTSWGVGEALFTVPIFEEYAGEDPTLPWLAEEWAFSEDLSSLTIQVREGVEFHDGWGEMTAEDVAFSLNDVKADVTPESIHNQAGDHAALFDGEWRAVDERTVEVDVAIPDPRMFSYNLGLLFQGPAIFSQTYTNDVGPDAARDNIIATGPFQVVQWLRDDRAELEARPDGHWRSDPAFDRLTIIAVPEASQRAAMLTTGEVDATDVLIHDLTGFLDAGFESASTGLAQQLGIFFSGNLWEEVHAQTGEPVEWEQTYQAVIPTIGHPNEPEQMEAARLVRTALAHAIDRELINEAVIDGHGYAVHHNYFNPNDENWDPQWEYEYNPELAMDLLAQTEWADGFRTQLYIGPELGGGLGIAGDVGDAVAGFWDAIGAETEVLKYAYAAFRPSVVARTNTIPWLTGCDEGRSTLPWDWPKGLVMTTLSRGGFGCGFESPWIAENFLNMVEEPDIQARTQMANDFLDYVHEWSLEVGVVAVPTQMVYNPQAIESWPMRLSAGPALNNVEDIQIVDR